METDRIVKINGFNLIRTQEIRYDRRNVECHSVQLEKYIKEFGLSNKNTQHIMSIGSLIQKKLLDDIVLVKVSGYY